MRCRILVFAVLFSLYQVAALSAAEVRYDDILYLDESQQPSLQLKALHRSPLGLIRDPNSVRAYLAEGQPVQIIGLGETQDYVEARIATGIARGWVEATALEAPPAELLTKLHERLEKEQAHRELIERHEIAVGMTRGEVRASLGKPDRISRLRSKEGEEDVWSYIVYKYLPHYVQASDTNGEVRQVVSYRRETDGHKVITFRNDEAVEISEVPDEKAHQPSITTAPSKPGNN